MLSTAIKIASTAFENKVDKSGKPYILHCLRVMNTVENQFPNDEELHIIAVLHDLIEDTDYTIDHLHEIGFSDRVQQSLYILTHRNKIPYEDYINEISISKDAIIVKLADLKDNSNITRLKEINRKDIRRIEKYHQAFVSLSKN